MLSTLRNLFRPTSFTDLLPELERELDFTPDMVKLEELDYHYVFEYGDAMRERPRYDVIDQHSFFHGIAFTKGENYKMLLNRMDLVPAHPILLKNNRADDFLAFGTPINDFAPARVKGEMHMVTPDGIKELDTYRLNGVQFRREKIEVNIPHRKHLKILDLETGHYDNKMTGQINHTREVWAYIAIPQYWRPLLDGGFRFPSVELTKVKGNNGRPFYHFAK